MQDDAPRVIVPLLLLLLRLYGDGRPHYCLNAFVCRAIDVDIVDGTFGEAEIKQPPLNVFPRISIINISIIL